MGKVIGMHAADRVSRRDTPYVPTRKISKKGFPLGNGWQALVVCLKA